MNSRELQVPRISSCDEEMRKATVVGAVGVSGIEGRTEPKRSWLDGAVAEIVAQSPWPGRVGRCEPADSPWRKSANGPGMQRLQTGNLQHAEIIFELAARRKIERRRPRCLRARERRTGNQATGDR